MVQKRAASAYKAWNVSFCRQENVYEKGECYLVGGSINSIFPLNKFIYADDVTVIHKENYELPSEKYFGINFSKLSKSYLEVRYMGGRGYEKKANDIKEITDYVATFTYGVLQNNQSYTAVENKEIVQILLH